MKFDIWGFLENLSISFNFHSNLTRITGTLHDDKYTFMIISAHFFLEWEIFRTKIVEKIKTHILYSLTFLRKSCLLWDNVEKLCRTGRATDDDKAYALFMLDTDTHSSYVTVIAFSNSTVVAPARLYVTLFVHCLSWCFSDRASWIDYILITNLIHWLLFIHKILFSSTCFEPQVLIFRRIQLYTCSICYCHSLREFLVACRYTAW